LAKALASALAETKMGHLCLALLGAPEVHHAGQSVTWRTRKTQALLLYLAVEGGLHTRQHLANLFWPERERSHGRAMLRTTLVYLRQALHPNPDPADPRWQHLLLEEDALGFDFASDFALDLHTLQTALHLDRAAQAPDLQSLLDHLNAAVRCYRGDFLTGFALTDALCAG
jgi:DNA-binding SARP family transcriptional activator